MRNALLSLTLLACSVWAGDLAHAQRPDVKIQPGDLVYIEVYRVAELTRTMQVDPGGNVDLTYVGKVRIGGMTEKNAAAQISQALKSILRNPRVTVLRTGDQLAMRPAVGLGRTDEMRMEIVPLHNASAENLAQVLTGMSSSGGHISHDPDTNTLVISDTPAALQNMMNIIARMDQMQAQLTQVRIETKIAEVRVGALKEIGLRWFVQGDQLSGGYYPPGSQNSFLNNRQGNLGPLAGEAIGQDRLGGTGSNREFVGGGFNQRLNVPVQVPLPGQAFLGYFNAGIDLGALLDALVSDDQADILANPMILTVNHKTARIKMVDEFPIFEFSTDITGATRETTEFMELGIVLDVTPHVYQDETGAYVKMELMPEVSFPSGSSNGVPIRSVRRSESIASVRDGQTLVVGGIMREEERELVSRVAGLGDLPVVGLLFKRKEQTKTRTELMIFVTPSVHRRPEEITLDKMLDVSEHLRTKDMVPMAELRREARKD